MLIDLRDPLPYWRSRRRPDAGYLTSSRRRLYFSWPYLITSDHPALFLLRLLDQAELLTLKLLDPLLRLPAFLLQLPDQMIDVRGLVLQFFDRPFDAALHHPVGDQIVEEIVRKGEKTAQLNLDVDIAAHVEQLRLESSQIALRS